MRVSVQADVVCTIEDGFHLMELARDAVDRTKLPHERKDYYPDSPTAALQILIRMAIAERLLTCGGVTLHEISHRITDSKLPL